MSSIELQLELEQRMIDAGAAAYLVTQRKAEEAGRGFQLDYAQKLMQEFMQPLVEALVEWCAIQGPGFLARSRAQLRQIDPEKAMFITLKNIFSSFTREQSPIDMAVHIGAMVEDELKFTKFRAEHEAYFDEIISDFNRKGTQDYRHMHRVLTHTSGKKDFVWEDWPAKLKADVGLKLLNLVMENTDLIRREDRYEKRKTITTIVPTQASIDWINQHEEFKQFMHPTRMPCIVQPADWTSLTDGGYYSPILRSNVHMVKSKMGKKRKKAIDYTATKRSLNGMQHVEWAVNKPILDVLVEVWSKNLQIGIPGSRKMEPPPSPLAGMEKTGATEEQMLEFIEWKREASHVYTLEKERISKSFQVTRVIRMAQEYKDYDRFWFVWYADFRGRFYSATSGFSPQGPDFAKGLLRFRRGKPLGERGWYWLRVHIANKFGYDKVSYDARIKWVDNQEAQFIACANDPLSYRHLWANADKPYQFLAALFEYAGAVTSGRPHDFVSCLPIGLDGSCNGIQNFSAMLRDTRGGTATNLVRGAKPSDIYSEVAGVLTKKVIAALEGPETSIGKDGQEINHHFFANKWLIYGISRKLCKRSVMTLPYGSTRQSCTEYIYAELLKNNRELFGRLMNFKAASWLMPMLWESIGEVVIAARAAMDWLRKSAGIMTKDGRPVEWTTPDGFVVYQKMCTIEIHKIDTILAGRYQARVGTITDILDANLQRNGVAPNFVHSYDAQHMRMTINALLDLGITEFSFIHDDYGTHACDTDTLHKVIREQFVKLYTEFDPLQMFCDEQEDKGVMLPALPAKGDLDITLVLDSPYFFG